MTHPLFDLSGRVAFVTGAASGMGRQMSIGFAEAGADVVLADINVPGAEETAHVIEKLGRRAIPIHCDVSKVEAFRAAYALIDKEFGRIDVVGNVAGEGKLTIPLEVEEDAMVQTLANAIVGWGRPLRPCRRRDAEGRGCGEKATAGPAAHNQKRQSSDTPAVRGSPRYSASTTWVDGVSRYSVSSRLRTKAVRRQRALVGSIPSDRLTRS